MTRADEYFVAKWNTTDEVWLWVPKAVCPQVVLNEGATPSAATITITGAQWNDNTAFDLGDTIKIEKVVRDQEGTSSLLFYGVITAWTPRFQGGNEQQKGDEVSEYFAQCPKYVLAKNDVVHGKYMLAQSAYPLAGAWDIASGNPAPDDTSKRVLADVSRCIFNEDGIGDEGEYTTDLTPDSPVEGQVYFTASNFSRIDTPTLWTAESIIVYILSNYTDPVASKLWTPQVLPSQSAGLDHDDWDTVINNVVCEQLNVIDALVYVAGLIGWQYRMDWFYRSANTHGIGLDHVFFKPGAATLGKRTSHDLTILHALYGNTGAQNQTDIAAGKSVPHSGNMIVDIEPVINNTTALARPKVSEITVELVPGWVQSGTGAINLLIDDDTDPLMLEDKDIEDLIKAGTNPNTRMVYARHHIDGSSFDAYHAAGRLWALNETGRYSVSAYDRGDPTDTAALVTGADRDNTAYLFRKVSECLTKDGDEHIKYYAEFTVDAGTTWHTLHNYGVRLLESEWGLYITEANLANIKLSGVTTAGTNGIYDGDTADTTDGKEVNYWTALVKDGEVPLDFKAGEWNVLVRLTASIVLDARLSLDTVISDSGSPFAQTRVFEYKGFETRIQESSSRFDGTTAYTVDTNDDLVALTAQQAIVDEANTQRAHSSHFAFPVIHDSDGDGINRRVRFLPGDCIKHIVGRNISFEGSDGKFARITQVTYAPEIAETTITLSDLRVAQVG
jgi:hypothetical protein